MLMKRANVSVDMLRSYLKLIDGGTLSKEDTETLQALIALAQKLPFKEAFAKPTTLRG
jgi:hypothetical protein